jgi:hypothetical protein
MHTAGRLEQWLKYLAIPKDWLRLSLNYAPPPLTCAFFSPLKMDLTDPTSQHAAGKKYSYEGAYEESQLASLSKKGGICDQILDKMHGAKGLFEQYFVDGEDEADGGRSLAFCEH